jgi:hypothetical protein
MTFSQPRSRSCRSASMRRRVLADYLAGLFLGCALVAMAIDQARQPSAPSPLPPARTLTHYPGP